MNFKPLPGQKSLYVPVKKLNTMKHQEFIDKVGNIAEQARIELINLIADVCRQHGGEIKFKCYLSLLDEDFGKVRNFGIYGARLRDDILYFIILDGAREEDAMFYSFDELYNICLSINNF